MPEWTPWRCSLRGWRPATSRWASLMVAVLALLAVLGKPGSANATAPVFSAVSPRGFQRGTEVTMTLRGGRLTGLQELMFYTPGFTVRELKVVNDATVEAKVQISSDTHLGEHSLRVRSQGGVSELRTFFVGALPTLDEKEPNTDFASPQKIPLNVTVHGIIQNEDVDYFAVECKKGQRLSVEIEGMRLANTLFDPYVAILDSRRFELTSSDDTPLLGQDGCCSIVIPADGTYIVQVRESAYGGNGACAYRLHVGTFPRPLGIIPAGGKAGDEVEVRFLGDPKGVLSRKIRLPAPGTDKTTTPFAVYAQDEGGISPSSLPFRVSEVGNVLEVEPNETHATATPATLPLAFNGVIEKAGDVDHFRFAAKGGQTYEVRCYARKLGSPLDSVMSIAALNGGTLVSNDDAGGPDSAFRFAVPKDGEYVLRITDHLGKGGPTYFYRVEFEPVRPIATLSIPKVALYSQERQVITVPRGNRMATLVTTTRTNFGGELFLGAPNLPPGVQLKADPVAANLDTAPIVFEADSSAPIAGRLTALTARPTDPKHPAIQSKFQGLVELVTGGPGQSVYWKHEVDRTAVAVAEEAPFSIRVIEPKVPLVQNGTINLQVVAERKAGFTGAITIFPLFNPPGVNSGTAVTLPANANEVAFPLNAAPNAQARKWKTALLASAPVGSGPIWVSSQLFTLEVAPPFLTFTLERSAVEQGKETEIFCKIQHLTPFEGEAEVKLLGLPFKVSASEARITKESKELSIKVTVDKTSPAGTHRNLFCQVILHKDGQPILHRVGSTELRIDVPLVQTTPTPMPKQVVTPKTVPNTPPKRLSRLEQLRLEQEERERQASGTQGKK